MRTRILARKVHLKDLGRTGNYIQYERILGACVFLFKSLIQKFSGKAFG